MNEYPYIDILISEKNIKYLFNLLKKNNHPNIPKNIKCPFNDIHFTIPWSNYELISLVTDYFSERCRVKCVFKNYKLSALQYFEKNKKKILNSSIINGKFSLKKFRDVMYFSNTKYCNKFNIIFSYYIYKIFKPKSILDSSSGWGDRLISAIAYGCEYTGYDPSYCLSPVYKKIIDTLTTNSNRKKYKVIKKPFEEANINKKYDLAFTSPPFFDLEVYEKSNNQSLNKYKNINSWIKNFLLKLVDKNIESLNVNGYFIIYVPSYDLFIKHMKNKKELMFCGNISYNFDYNNNIKTQNRNVGVWKKIN